MANLDGLDIGFVVVADDESIEPVRTALDRVIGNCCNLLECIDQQAGRHREAGPQNIILVREGRLHAYGATRLIDLIVHEGEPPFGQRLYAVGAQCLHRDGSLLERLVDLRHLLFWRRENH